MFTNTGNDSKLKKKKRQFEIRTLEATSTGTRGFKTSREIQNVG